MSTAFPECWFRLEVEIISLKVPTLNFLEEKDMYERLERFLEKPNIRGSEGAMKMDKQERSNWEELAIAGEEEG